MKPRHSTRSKQRFLFWTVGLVTALLAIACAPAAPAESAPAAEPPVSVDSAPATLAATSESEPAVVPLTEVPAVVELPSFLPRGASLEATDPATVALASGGLQLVEFFRFT